MNPQDDAPAAASSELGRHERLSRWLVQHAARNSPAALADRLEEEWLAALAAQDGPLSRLWFAIGCCWATRVIAHDYLASHASVSAPATEHGTIILGQYDSSYFSRRTTILLLIVGLHLIVIYGFATGFGQGVIEPIPGRMKTTVWDTPRSVDFPPPRIASHLATAKPIVPDVVPLFELPRETAIENTSIPNPQPPPMRPPISKAVNRILGGPGVGFPNTGDYYPLASRRLGEIGVATVRVCVDRTGRLASAPTIEKSSGFARLDDAALHLAKAGAGHYRSTTEDGIPVPSCYPFRIRFQLNE